MSADSVFRKWFPVTSDFGLIEAPAEAVCQTYSAWCTEIGKEVSVKASIGALDEQFSSLLPLTIGKNHALILSTSSNWTAFFRNGIQGSDPASAMPVLSGKLHAQAMRLCISREPQKYRATIWELYEPPEGHTRRSIAAANDGGRWVFETYGEPFQFEVTERYSLSRKADRFDEKLLSEYLSHFGVPQIGDQLFGTDGPINGWLVSYPNWHHAREFSLGEVVAGVPWER